MKTLLIRLWADDVGAIVATELIFVLTILIIGLVVGLKAVQSAVLNELEEVAGAIGSVSQSFSYGGTSGCCSFTAGSSFTDNGPNTYPVNVCAPVAAQDPVPCSD
jgi:hypothetical protein